LGEPGDVSVAYNYGLLDILMNNLWVYDFFMLEEFQNFQIFGFPMQESHEYVASDPALSSSLFSFDMHHNRWNDDPNSIKITEMIESKVTRKSKKGPRRKGC
jgi:hypothetical protein